jgi:putative oxidoreductase
MKLGLALLRMIVGGLFVGHGLQKLAGRFGGHGLEGTGAAFEQLGLRPGKAHAAAAGAAETGGGALLVAGALTPLAAALLSGSMITAIRKVHAPRGPWVAEGGYEYNLTLIAAVVALADLGPGAWSLEGVRGRHFYGPGWALAALAAGAAGSTLAIAAGERAGATAGPEGAGPSQDGHGEPTVPEHSSEGATA